MPVHAEEGLPLSLVKSLKLFTGFKADGLAGRNRHLSPGARIAANSGLARAYIENAETSEFDSFAVSQRTFHAFEDRFYGHFGFRLGNSRPVDYFIDNVELDQGNPPAVMLQRYGATSPSCCDGKPHDRIEVTLLSSMTSRPFTADLFRRVCSQFATGVAIATVLDEFGVPHGLTINSFTSVSLDPPLVLICIDYRSAILQRFRRASHFGINVLTAMQRDLSNRFATKPDDRFDGITWQAGLSGVPLIEGSLANFECLNRQVVESGDHAIFIGEVVAAESNTGEPLLFFDSSYRLLA
jgi:flavin reductase (DIM6/NTAB) family NADH-FMN oxidoreductase RutF